MTSVIAEDPSPQVMVRLSSIGFCCGELAEVQAKLFKMVGSPKLGQRRLNPHVWISQRYSSFQSPSFSMKSASEWKSPVGEGTDSSPSLQPRSTLEMTTVAPLLVTMKPGC